MGKRNRILVAGAMALALVALASPQHRASIQILTHDQGDISPQRMQAVLDLGLVGVSVLITWSKRLGY